jgi:predicted Na+-dependent transporter
MEREAGLMFLGGVIVFFAVLVGLCLLAKRFLPGLRKRLAKADAWVSRRSLLFWLCCIMSLFALRHATEFWQILSLLLFFGVVSLFLLLVGGCFAHLFGLNRPRK